MNRDETNETRIVKICSTAGAWSADTLLSNLATDLLVLVKYKPVETRGQTYFALGSIQVSVFLIKWDIFILTFQATITIFTTI